MQWVELMESLLSHRLKKLSRVVWSRSGRRGLRHGVAMATEHDEALEPFAFRTIVDVGANRGQFSLFCERRFPDARLLAFEPLPEAARTYGQLFGDIPGHQLFVVAIGPRNGEATMHVSRRDDSSSLLPIGDLQKRIFPGTDERGTESVEVGRLARFISSADLAPPAMLKIDVQGFELEVLEGCTELLDCFDVVYVECSYIELYEGQKLAPHVISFLDSRGFIHVATHNELHDAAFGLVQADLVFTRHS